MEIQTTRFGRLRFTDDDVIWLPEGLPGLSECRDWVILADEENDAIAWMQSVERPEVALAIVSPRRFVPGYQLRVARRELEPLRLTEPETAQVVAIVTRTQRGLAVNLKAPIVINLDRRLGRQVLANGDLPILYELENADPLKKTA